MLLADGISTAENFVSTLTYVYMACVLAYIISSWIPLPYNVWLNRVQRFLYVVVNPYLSVFRRLLPQLSTRGLDFSPILAILVLVAANRILIRLIELLR